MISIIVEHLDHRTIRVTAREQGRSLWWRDGAASQQFHLISKALQTAAFAHQYPDGTYDSNHIRVHGVSPSIADRLFARVLRTV